jgi:glycosyltransferase involved in cell wall biosynthesis
MARRYIFPALVHRDWALAVGVFQGIWEGLNQKRRPIELLPESGRPTAAAGTVSRPAARRVNRILLIGVLGPFDSGPTRVYETLLKSHFSERFDVRFLDLQFASDIADFERLRLQKFLRLLWYLLRATYWLFRESYQAICVPLSTNRNAFLKDSLFVWLGVVFRVPVVILEHGTNIPALYQRSGRIVRGSMRATLRRAARCIVLAECLKFNFEPFLPADRIVSTYLGISRAATNGKPALNTSQNGKLTLLFLSTLVEAKGLLIFLRSLPRVLRGRNDPKFVVAGGWGWDSEHVKAWVNQFLAREHLEGSVSFVGPVKGAEKQEVLNAADICVCPTLVDTAPLVVLEAMRAGLPIVATNVGAIPEIVVDGVNGLICEKGNPEALADKILYLADRPALRQKIRQNNLERFEKLFTAERFADRMIKVFESVFAEAQGRS